MSKISAQTYARAFSVDSNIMEAAGNYESSIAAKVAKGIVGVLTLGIGYGIIRLVEEFCIVQPKMNEFCSNAPHVYKALLEAIKCGKETVEVKLQDGREIKFTQIYDRKNDRHTVLISDEVNTEEVGFSLVDILEKLDEDFLRAPAYYRLSDSQLKYVERHYASSVDRVAEKNMHKSRDGAIPVRIHYKDAEEDKEARCKHLGAANERFNKEYVFDETPVHKNKNPDKIFRFNVDVKVAKIPLSAPLEPEKPLIKLDPAALKESPSKLHNRQR